MGWFSKFIKLSSSNLFTMRCIMVALLAITFIAGLAGLAYYFRYEIGICEKKGQPEVPDVVANCWVNQQGKAQPYLIALLVVGWLLVLSILAYCLLKAKAHEDEEVGIRYLIDVEYGVDEELAKKKGLMDKKKEKKKKKKKDDKVEVVVEK